MKKKKKYEYLVPKTDDFDYWKTPKYIKPKSNQTHLTETPITTENYKPNLGRWFVDDYQEKYEVWVQPFLEKQIEKTQEYLIDYDVDEKERKDLSKIIHNIEMGVNE